MKVFYIVLIIIGSLGGLVGLSYGAGWVGVHQTKTIGKAQKNAEREVFEQTQSYVFSKKQEALKMYGEHNDSEFEKQKSIRMLVRMSFAEFDESKLDEPLRSFIYKCKYE